MLSGRSKAESKEIATHQIFLAINSALRICEIFISKVTWELGKKIVSSVSVFSMYYFGLLLTGKKIGFFIVFIV